MTQTAYTNAIVDAMLSWLKGVASWVLKLFHLSGGASPLKFLANNWLKLLILFLIIGVAVDLLVWLVRWRPYWIWFRKKRVIINDKNFFAREDYITEGGSRRRGGSRRNWVDQEYVVPSRYVRKPQPRPEKRPARPIKPEMERAAAAEPRDVFQDDLFNVNAKQKFSDKYEDEVFNVSNLPKPEHAQKSASKSVKKNAKPRRTQAEDDLFLEWKD